MKILIKWENSFKNYQNWQEKKKSWITLCLLKKFNPKFTPVKTAGPDNFTGESYQIFKELTPIYTFFQGTEEFLNLLRGLPWWRSGWESACQCRGHGFEPWSGKIPHAAEQLGPWATTTEPARLQPVLRNKRGRDSERPAHRDEEWPPLAATRESPRTETKTQHSPK